MHRAAPEHLLSVFSAIERLTRFAPPCTKSCTRGCRCQHKALDDVHAGFLRGEFHKGDYRPQASEGSFFYQAPPPLPSSTLRRL